MRECNEEVQGHFQFLVKTKTVALSINPSLDHQFNIMTYEWERESHISKKELP